MFFEFEFQIQTLLRYFKFTLLLNIIIFYNILLYSYESSNFVNI